MDVLKSQRFLDCMKKLDLLDQELTNNLPNVY